MSLLTLFQLGAMCTTTLATMNCASMAAAAMLALAFHSYHTLRQYGIALTDEGTGKNQ